MRFAKTVDLECRLCFTLHTVEVEYDEDGGHAEIERTPCHDADCTRKICGACPQFTCFCCGLTFCLQADHIGLEEEPDCTCVQTDVDQVDARYCGLHSTRYPKTGTGAGCVRRRKWLRSGWSRRPRSFRGSSRRWPE